MTDARSARVACVPPAFVDGATSAALADWRTSVDPDLVVLTGTSPAPRSASQLRRRTGEDTLVVHPAGYAPTAGAREVAGIQFGVVPSTDAVTEIAGAIGTTLDPDEPTFVVGDRLVLDVDRSALATRLVGLEEYREALSAGAAGTGGTAGAGGAGGSNVELVGEPDVDPVDGPHAELVHLSTRLPVGYRRERDGLRIVGVASGAESADGSAGGPGERAPAPTVVDCGSDGRVLTRTLDPDRFGLRAVDGVGATRAERLREAGVEDRAALAEASVETVAAIEGIGRQTARDLLARARGTTRHSVERLTDEPLPVEDPIFLDVETDGLRPTITWLIGVLDGGPDEGEYRAFLQRDPDDPGGAIEAFLSWYRAEAAGRPIAAYNGQRFDFDVLDDHVREYRPALLDAWTEIPTFDPFHWAVTDGNAALPGRTNRLEAVAGALGYDRSSGERGQGQSSEDDVADAATDLTGAAVARTYRRWITERTPEAEPDWDRFERYCEHDVRALATVYDALAASESPVATAASPGGPAESTVQVQLSEW